MISVVKCWLNFAINRSIIKSFNGNEGEKLMNRKIQKIMASSAGAFKLPAGFLPWLHRTLGVSGHHRRVSE